VERLFVALPGTSRKLGESGIMRGGKVTIERCMQMMKKEKTKCEREIKEQLAQFNRASMKRFVVVEVFLIGEPKNLVAPSQFTRI
jgi:5-methylcytosine-specific restriction endonuclease McrBC GTP-binding regulatory subunit McrB